MAMELTYLSLLCSGLFQITVKLPHDPYKIQVMVGVDSLRALIDTT